ncbi:DUF3301 domain-containing protein [Oceanicoccus sagamiensis]|uniref:DUF3301 domain-containing protein n=1 Tax=Oceanicoccus sagamiensis TaxID=716816 RepID=A0A1X9NEQ9_9GAMM|nr:DUF3301 domain-containing protein [Oceanicoccus sagamiensis]ARN74922.1 hypothetical protein BST96_12840 [Oceanicoccus sagamiensis]
MFELGDVFVGFVFIAFVMLWWNAQGVKQKALMATRDHCKRMNVQLLDDGVALKGFWFKRHNNGNLMLWRSYNFEFTSTGNERYKGQVIMLGRFVEKIQMDAYRIND